jgi:hypothetical protein
MLQRCRGGVNSSTSLDFWAQRNGPPETGRPVDLGRDWVAGQATEQAVPFRLNAAGFPVPPVWSAWNPKLVDPLAGIDAL